MPLSTVPYALCVDDDGLILIDACAIMENAGFRSYEASNADDALRLLSEKYESVILLFTDVEMPGSMNGFGLAREVAKRWPHIEIIVASGRAKPNHGDMPAKATFIAKPFSAQLVHSHLAQILPDGKKPEPLKKAI